MLPTWALLACVEVELQGFFLCDFWLEWGSHYLKVFCLAMLSLLVLWLERAGCFFIWSVTIDIFGCWHSVSDI